MNTPENIEISIKSLQTFLLFIVKMSNKEVLHEEGKHSINSIRLAMFYSELQNNSRVSSGLLDCSISL